MTTNKLDAEQPSLFNVAGNRDLEIYDYPGGYARKYDGVDRAGSERQSDLQNVFKDKQKTAEVAMQALDARYKTANGIADCSSMTAGYRFKMINHPDNDLNGQYVITLLMHEIDQEPSYISGEATTGESYTNSFSCISYGVNSPPFRPIRKTPKPIVQGSQTAFVVGPAGEEIFTDKYGRVKVQFHWDRTGQTDSKSSCWVRIAKDAAGNRWGTLFIPRIGQEVIVAFLEGDPDQPIITGSVNNPENMPPYKLPDEKTKTVLFKSLSSKGGDGFNEFRIEDRKGSEQIFIHGEKNLDVRVKNDSLEYVGKNRHLIIKRDQREEVQKDKHSQIGGDKNEKVNGSASLNVEMDLNEKVGVNYALDAGTEIHLKSGMNLTIETGANLTLKVGENFININPGGIFMHGTKVMINSGGTAGTGSGSNPDAPQLPKEADKAEKGSLSKQAAKPALPFLRTKQQVTQAAQVLIDAAKEGKPFCAICSRK